MGSNGLMSHGNLCWFWSEAHTIKANEMQGDVCWNSDVEKPACSPAWYEIWNCGSHFSVRRGDSKVARRPQNRAKGEAKPWRADKRHASLETLFDLLSRALSEVDFASLVFIDVTNKSLLLFKAIELFYLHLKLKDTD